ncbi:hypothetical protein [Pseudofrankia sp. BMG5.37]|uniref:hypothetical protein n=1 Tax=Pseudofrankia sp. BMG5.37 TaxID=3050035 RepID=UPI0037C79721
MLALPAGVLADATDRRRLLIGVHGGRHDHLCRIGRVGLVRGARSVLGARAYLPPRREQRTDPHSLPVARPGSRPVTRSGRGRSTSAT